MSSLRKSYSAIAKPIKRVYSRSITDDGTLSGSKDMAVDGSTATVEFWCEPDPNNILVIGAISLMVSDNGNPDEHDYGNLAGGLSNGIKLFIDNAEGRVVFSNILRNNIDIAISARRYDVNTFAGGNRIITFHKMYLDFSDGIKLEEGDKFGVIIGDDLSSLTAHSMGVEGNQQLKII